jgi:hypothetical protein
MDRTGDIATPFGDDTALEVDPIRFAVSSMTCGEFRQE